MRVSKDDKISKHVVSVTVDGVEVRWRCFLADDVEGIAECYQVTDPERPYLGDRMPRYVLGPDRKPLTETLRGEVKIVLRAPRMPDPNHPYENDYRTGRRHPA